MAHPIQSIINNEKKFNDVARSAFSLVDIDGSGTIDIKELKIVMKILANDFGAEPPNQDDVMEVMRCLDPEKKNYIDFERFKLLIKSILCMMTDSDY